MDTDPTIVIYRTFTEDGSTVALFPLEPGTADAATCMSYMHVGQHGAASMDLMREGTRPATEAEAGELARELVALGYNLEPRKRTPHNAYRIRLGKLARVRS